MSPGSHRFDPAAPETTSFDRRVAAGGSATAGGAAAAVGGPRLRLALPAGSVAVYALHLLHRGSANTAPADRPFYFFTLKGPGCAGESTPPPSQTPSRRSRFARRPSFPRRVCAQVRAARAGVHDRALGHCALEPARHGAPRAGAAMLTGRPASDEMTSRRLGFVWFPESAVRATAWSRSRRADADSDRSDRTPWSPECARRDRTRLGTRAPASAWSMLASALRGSRRSRSSCVRL